jgi:hypothetical protein
MIVSDHNESMSELNVTFLDLYLIIYLSAEHLEFGDGRHYTPKSSTSNYWTGYMASLNVFLNKLSS